MPGESGFCMERKAGRRRSREWKRCGTFRKRERVLVLWGEKRSEGEMAESGIFLFLHLFPSASFPASGGADRLQKENN